MQKRAFTLLEALVYLALAAIFLGGILSCAYSLIVSASAEQAKILLQEEGQFLIGKFDWAFLGAKNFTVSDGGQTLTVNTYDSAWPVIFTSQIGRARLAADGNIPADLNAEAVIVDSLLFRDVPATSGRPEGLDISYVLETLDSRGRLARQDFSFTEYLQQY